MSNKLSSIIPSIQNEKEAAIIEETREFAEHWGIEFSNIHQTMILNAIREYAQNKTKELSNYDKIKKEAKKRYPHHPMQQERFIEGAMFNSN